MGYLWSLVTVLVLYVSVFLLYKLTVTALSLYKTAQALASVPDMPNRHWFWGNVLYFRKLFDDESETPKYLEYVYKNNLKMIRAWIGPFACFVQINSSTLLPKVLTKLPKNNFTYSMLKPWLGDGLLISEGNKWFRNRRLLTPAFHYAILMPYIQVYNDCTQIMLNKWSAAAKVNDPVCLFESVSLLSLDIILRCSFSFNSNCQTSTTKEPYILHVQKIVELVTNRFASLLSRWDWYYNLTKNGREFKKYCDLVHDYSDVVIANRKKELGMRSDGVQLSEAEVQSRKNGKYLDFLDVLLIAQDEDGNGLSHQEIRDEVNTFMFEGHDTTTSCMCWTLYCLAKNPEAQERVREEVRGVLQGRNNLDYNDLKELKYTQWAIKEAMRIYPPVFFVTRETAKPIQLNGVNIPKGVRVDINIRSIHHQPDVWENPDEYDPLRFHPSNCEGRDPYAYIPFSGGYRNCIGQNFALNEGKVVIASIVNRYKLSLVHGHKVETSPRIVLKSTNDIKINLESLVQQE